MANLVPTREIDRLVSAAPGPDDAELLRRYRDTGDPEAFAGDRKSTRLNSSH